MTRWLAAVIVVRSFAVACDCSTSARWDAGSGAADAAWEDAGADAGAPDAGAPDAGSLDAGSFDAGSPDAGPSDAGVLDAGVVDAGHAPGSLDLSFGDGGRVLLVLSTSDTLFGLAVQGDGRAVVGGAADQGRMAFARFAVDGTPDPTFGAGTGFVAFNVDSGTGDAVFALQLLPDGGILGSGNTTYDTPDASIVNPAAARLRGDGTAEAGFGTSGIASFFVGAAAWCPAVGLLADGSAILGCHRNPGAADFLALKVRPDGQVDTAFNGTGIATLTAASDDTECALALQPDGHVVLGGRSDAKASLARFTAAGAVDTAFGDGGLLIDDLSPGIESSFHAVLAQADGKLVGVGYRGAGPEPIAVRYDSSGSHDPSFGAGGVATLPLVGQAFAGFLDNSGRIVVAGHVNDAFFVARLLPTGASDPTFGPDGGGYTVVDHGGVTNNWGFAIAQGPDGRIVVAGPSGTHFGLVRFWP
jgi:uncharacterized delta-60 repeat protein